MAKEFTLFVPEVVSHRLQLPAGRVVALIYIPCMIEDRLISITFHERLRSSLIEEVSAFQRSISHTPDDDNATKPHSILFPPHLSRNYSIDTAGTRILRALGGPDDDQSRYLRVAVKYTIAQLCKKAGLSSAGKMLCANIRAVHDTPTDDHSVGKPLPMYSKIPLLCPTPIARCLGKEGDVVSEVCISAVDRTWYDVELLHLTGADIAAFAESLAPWLKSNDDLCNSNLWGFRQSLDVDLEVPIPVHHFVDMSKAVYAAINDIAALISFQQSIDPVPSSIHLRKLGHYRKRHTEF